MYDKEYYQKYYRKHRRVLLAEKKRRYASDPRYRMALIEASKRRRLENHIEKPRRRGLRGDKRYLTRVVRIGERDVVVHSVSVLADTIGFSLATVYLWERRGVLPPATAIDELGRRWYSDKFIRWFGDCLLRYRKKMLRLAVWKVLVAADYAQALKRGAVEGNVVVVGKEVLDGC